MSDIQVFPALPHDLCRAVSKQEFSLLSEENLIHFRAETRLSRPCSQMLVNDLESNPGLAPPADRDRTFIAHFHNALLVHDVMAVIASGNRALTPDMWDDYAMFHTAERYQNRPAHKVPYPVTWTEQLLRNELDYYIGRSPMFHATMANGPRESIRWDIFLKGHTSAVPHLVISAPHILLSNTSMSSYFHVVMDVLSRLWIFDEWPEFRRLPIIIPPLGDKFEQALADAIGVPRSQLLVLSNGTAARFTFKHLLFPSAVNDRLVTAERLAFIRSKLVGGPAPSVAAKPWRRLYLSRADRPYKTVANETELLAALRTHGVETVNTAALSVAEQARLFGEAELLVGASGGGFANMAFMPPGAVVLELSQITPPQLGRKRQIVMELANLCRLHHMVLTSRMDVHAMPRFSMTPVLECPTSMIYDVERVRKTVEGCLAWLRCQGETGACAEYRASWA